MEDTMKKASDFRFEARTALKNNLGWAILTLLAFGAISSLAGSLGLGVGSLIIYGAMAVGMSLAFVGMFRKGKLEFVDLFAAFNNNFVNAMVMGLLQTLFIFLWSLLFVIPGIIATLSYSMAPYIQADNPEMSGTEAITASKNLMRGKKWSLFCLNFSFIGWIILSLLTMGILYFAYVGPYTKAAEAAFYESIKDELAAGSPDSSEPIYQPSGDSASGN